MAIALQGRFGVASRVGRRVARLARRCARSVAGVLHAHLDASTIRGRGRVHWLGAGLTSAAALALPAIYGLTRLLTLPEAPAGLLIELGLVALLSVLMASVAYLACIVLPLRSLTRTLASLDDANARSQHHTALIDAAYEDKNQGIAVFDAAERIVAASPSYASLYGLDASCITPGTTIGALIESRTARGIYGDEPAAALLARVRELVRLPYPSQYVRRLSDGRSLRSRVQPLSEGGWIVIQEDVTERENLNARLEQQNELLRKREEELNEQNRRFDTAITHMHQGMCLFDAEHRVVFANQHYAEIYGLEPEAIKPGMTLIDIVAMRMARGIYTPEFTASVEREGTEFVSREVSKIVPLADGRFISLMRRRLPDGGLVSTHEDITQREQLKLQLERQEEILRVKNLHLDAALNNMIQGLAMFDRDYRLVLANNRFAEIYDLPLEQLQPGTSVSQILSRRIADGRIVGSSAEDIMQAAMARIEGRDVAQFTTNLRDGRTIAVSYRRMADGSMVTTHQDITEQRRSEAKIVHMAMHDALTDLPNRTLLNERLEQALARARRGGMLAVHLLDLDNFKAVNDTMGHPVGDTLLQEVTARLRSILRECDTVARMGGDEFAILQVGISDPAEAVPLAQRVIETISAPYLIAGQTLVIGTSIGIAIGPADGLAPDELIRNADLALYRAKGDGRGIHRFFRPEMDSEMQARRAMERDLRDGLATGAFELHYQPIANLQSNRITGVEALIRWRHPERGMVSPGSFIRAAEEMGFIVPLGEWAVREACRTAAQWPEHISVSVNLSPLQFKSPGFVEAVTNALLRSGLAAERLELEITESVLMQERESTLSILHQLRGLGVRTAMDDFGTGYSSLSYLQSFPFDKIKIDRSFIRDIADGGGSLNIVRAITAMAKGLGMVTTAEGVETREQLEAVRAEGCTEAQGFYFSKPLPAHQIAPLLAAGRRNRDAA